MRRVVAALLAGPLLMLGPVAESASAAAPAGQQPTAWPAIVNGNRQSVQDAYFDRFVAADRVETSWNGSVVSCNPGTLVPKTQQASLEAVNFVRAIVGLQPVALSDALSAKAQQAALIMEANDTLDHYPDESYACATADGIDAAGHSNLSMMGGDPSPAAHIRNYMDDGGESNAPAGHRSWILRPETTVMGSGATSAYHALWVVQGNDDVAPTKTVAWPSAGYFPSQLEPGGRWSFAAEGSVSLAQATVTMTGPSGPIPVETTPGFLGDGMIVWDTQTELAVPGKGQPDTTYTITVSGGKRGATAVAPYSYSVTLFHAERRNTMLTAPSVVTTGTSPFKVGDLVTIDPGTWSEGFEEFFVNWYRDGREMDEYENYHRFTRADAGHRITAEVFVASYADGVIDPDDGVAVTVGTVQALPSGLLPALRLSRAPKITGKLRPGKIVQVADRKVLPKVAGLKVAYRWFRDGRRIAGATRLHQVRNADRGHRLRVRLTLNAPGHAAGQAQWSAPTARIKR